MTIPHDVLPPPPAKPQPYMLGLAIICGLFLIFVVGFGAYRIATTSGPLQETKTVVIPHGTNISGMATILVDDGVLASKASFEIAARLFAHGSLKSGEYEITAHSSAKDIVALMQSGKTVMRTFMVPEGLTVYDITQLLSAAPVMTGEISPMPAEGSLFPNSYRYSYGDTRAEMISRMQKHMQDSLNTLWAARDTDLPLHSPQEALALASVVEKETGKAEERPRIAGVFYNRLRLGMRLQSDPTVAYAILLAHNGKPLGRELEHDDLAFASPINTYASDGIPAQPICNPGKAAIEAVLHPEKNDFLYFVADGNGGHMFAKNLAEHNHNINLYRYGKD